MLTFLTLYSCIHFYAFIKLRHAFQPRPQLSRILITWLIIMTISPLLVRGAEKFGLENTALIIAWPGYIWMGFIFIFTCIMLFTDAALYFYFNVIWLYSKQLPEYISSRYICIFTLMLTLSFTVYAVIEANQIQSKHVIIASSKLPSSISRFRIVQVSDVHIGLLLQKNRLLNILEKIREAEPDILVSTGDLIDGKLNRDFGISYNKPLAALLSSIPTTYGKFGVIGNHEVYAGLSQSVSFSRAAGFTILRNQSIKLMSGITITGIDDLAVNPNGVADQGTETLLISSAPIDSFHLLLKHRPEILPESDGHFDLQLSGHTHGGQIFPFNLLVRLKNTFSIGSATTKAGSYIHVSRGTGTWGPPMRLFAPPEVTIIDIIPKTKILSDKVS